MAASSADAIQKVAQSERGCHGVDRKGAADLVASLETVGETMDVICTFLKDFSYIGLDFVLEG